MTSRTCALSLLVALSACGPGNGSDTGSSGGSGSSSGAGSSGAGSSGAPTTGPTTGAITGGATEAGSTSTTPSSSSSPSTSSSPSEPVTSSMGATSGTSDGSGGTSGASTDGNAGACVDVSGDYGPCEAIIGYGFDGTSCRAFSGCNCAPHCDDFAPDPVTCALGCAAAGECNEAALHPAGINKDPVMAGSFCDELDACADAERLAWLTQIFGKIECEPAGALCAGAQNCHLLWQGQLDATQWPKVCAASLLPAADLQCVIFGP
jgi:hypothetical protein